MFFRRKRNVKLELTANALKYFSQLDTALQAASFADGLFSGSFLYFRGYYFSLIDKEMSRMTQVEKLAYVEKNKHDQLRTLSALSKILKDEVFKDYLNKMYSLEEQKEILQKIEEFPKQISISPTNKVVNSNE